MQCPQHFQCLGFVVIQSQPIAHDEALQLALCIQHPSTEVANTGMDAMSLIGPSCHPVPG
jgi:hypothetical protein